MNQLQFFFACLSSGCSAVWPPLSLRGRTPTTPFARVWTLTTTSRWRLLCLPLRASPRSPSKENALRRPSKSKAAFRNNAASFVFCFRDFAAGICNKISEMIQGERRFLSAMLLRRPSRLRASPRCLRSRFGNSGGPEAEVDPHAAAHAPRRQPGVQQQRAPAAAGQLLPLHAHGHRHPAHLHPAGRLLLD